MSMNIKTGDTVVVLSGKDKGKQGKVLGTIPSERKVVVEGVNVAICHVKPRRQGETGGIVDAEGAMYVSKVALYCPQCDKGVRIHHVVEDDKKIRVCAKCGHKFD